MKYTKIIWCFSSLILSLLITPPIYALRMYTTWDSLIESSDLIAKAYLNKTELEFPRINAHFQIMEVYKGEMMNEVVVSGELQREDSADLRELGEYFIFLRKSEEKSVM